MKVKLLNYTPLWVCSTAIRKCWASEDKSDTKEYEADVAGGDIEDFSLQGTKITGPKDKALIDRIGNKNKHSSTLAHIWYTFEIKGWNDHVKTECLENKYVIISGDILTINLRSLKDMYEDDKYLLYRNTLLAQLYNKLPEEHVYLVKEIYNKFLKNPQNIDKYHIIFENGVVIKIKNTNEKDTTPTPYYKIPYKNSDGYYYYSNLYCDGKHNGVVFHHRMIAISFIPNPDNKPFVNHIDGNKTNNSVDNLEWVTSSENEIHSYEKLHKQIWNKYNKLPSGREYRGKIRTVDQIDPNTNKVVKTWFNPSEAELFGGFSLSQISAVCKGRQKTHKGYLWRYQNEY